MTALLDKVGTFTALVEEATLAPSSHNTQPWWFRLQDDAIEVHADRTRALPVNDPRDRELAISCGAAITNLCVAAEHRHFAPRVELLPDDEDPDHLATVHLTPTEPYTDARLAYGIRLRRTWRSAFAPRPIPDDVVAEVLAAGRQEGVFVDVLSEEDLPELVGLISGGDHFQFSEPSWRRELAAWMHPRRSGDGLVVPAVGGALARFVVSHVDIGERTARDDAEMTASAPLVVVLSSVADDQRAWLTVGQALERMLLTAAVRGVQAGFSNQPCQVAVLRPLLGAVMQREHPQMVLRLGYPTETPTATPRRPVESVLAD